VQPRANQLVAIMERDFELRQAEQAWLAGGSALPVVELLVARDAVTEAATVARLALAEPDCPDAETLEVLLDRLANTPAGWADQLREFAASSSLERWRDLIRFVPEDNLYQRLRNSIRQLRALEVDGSLLFLCATEYGLIPEAIELVEDGCVSVDAILERAETSRGARAAYVGLAAQAAFLAGDMLGTVRLLRESIALQTEWCSALPAIWYIRERATPEQNELLDRAGIPAK
jgi:hypothetical protein